MELTKGDMGHMGGLTNPAHGVEDAESVFQVPVGLPCFERGRLVKKDTVTIFPDTHILCAYPRRPHVTYVPTTSDENNKYKIKVNLIWMKKSK